MGLTHIIQQNLEIGELKDHTAPLWMSLAFSPDGRRIVSCSDDSGMILWDAENHLKLLELDGHTSKINSVACSSDGRFIASAGQDGTCKLWDAGRLPIADDEAE